MEKRGLVIESVMKKRLSSFKLRRNQKDKREINKKDFAFD